MIFLTPYCISGTKENMARPLYQASNLPIHATHIKIFNITTVQETDPSLTFGCIDHVLYETNYLRLIAKWKQVLLITLTTATDFLS